MNIDPDDLVAMREQGDLTTYLLTLGGLTRTARQAPAELEEPPYHIPRKGAWPCGTAPSGPTPQPCSDCSPTSRTESR